MLSEVEHHARFTLEADETFRFKPPDRGEVLVTSFSVHWTALAGPCGVDLHGCYTSARHTHQSTTVPGVRPSLLPTHVQRAVITITK
jgi:hypothetical protein